MSPRRLAQVPRPAVQLRSRSCGRLAAVAVAVLVTGAADAAARPIPLPAQQPGSVAGSLVDSEGQPLANANVVIVGTQVGGMTRKSGRFQLDRVPAGTRMLEARLLGFEPARIMLEVEPGRVTRVVVQMVVGPVEMEEVTVTTMRSSAAIQGFYDRRARGHGHFFTREEIAKMEARAFSDVLRRVPGAVVRQVSGRYGTEHNVQMGRATGITGNRGCPVLYYMNGMPFPLAPGFSIDQYVRPDEIAGVEVYTGSSRLPPQFHASTQNARCGVVVIWTRSGGSGRESGAG